MFLMYPPSDSPLEWIHNITGAQFYIPGLLVLVTAVLLFEYLIYEGARKVFSR